MSSNLRSPFFKYLAHFGLNDTERLPSLPDLSQQLGVSVATLREQLEVAKALGLVEVRPRTGIRRVPYSFTPSIKTSLVFAVTADPDCFQAYSELRSRLESAFWQPAVCLLTTEDHAVLNRLLQTAMQKLSGTPVQIPHSEHRKLHLTIYSRLKNPFVTGLLEAYWDVYELYGLDVYTDYEYLQQVWRYHEKMVNSICSGEFTIGHQALTDHIDLLFQRAKPIPKQAFE